MATRAIHAGVLADQRESKFAVIESSRKAVHAIMTAHAIRSIIRQMRQHERGVNLIMADLTNHRIEFCDAIGMTIGADKRSSVDVLLVAV